MDLDLTKNEFLFEDGHSPRDADQIEDDLFDLMAVKEELAILIHTMQVKLDYKPIKKGALSFTAAALEQVVDELIEPVYEYLVKELGGESWPDEIPACSHIRLFSRYRPVKSTN